jgi:hypothetical protein
MSVERIVRPFQSGTVFSARTVMPTIPTSGSNVSNDVPRLEWSGENPGDYDSIPSEQIFNNFKVEWEENKEARVTETVRIEQEDNPENYIEVERVQSAQMREGITGKTFNLKFASWAKGRS